jgi:hypothetical protein
MSLQELILIVIVIGKSYWGIQHTAYTSTPAHDGWDAVVVARQHAHQTGQSLSPTSASIQLLKYYYY